MNTMIKKISIGISILMLFGLFLPAVTMAQTTVTEKQQARITNIKTKAGEEIDRRITVLNALTGRFSEMKKLTDADKSQVSAYAQTTIADLAALKTKIESDTDLATLQTDRQSIAKSYRVFMLVVPQGRILAAADRILNTVDLMNTVVAKIETALTKAQNDGKDVATLEAALIDMKTKIADATTQATTAKSAVLSLVPDKGVQAQIDSNTAALKSARDMIKAAVADLVAARADVGSIRAGIKNTVK